MNKDKRNNIQLLGTLNNSDESGIIANANQVYDANEDKSTQDVSKEHTERIKTLEDKENSMQTTLENITKTGEASAASNVTYNHSDSKLDATNVQQAIDEVRKRSNYNDGDNIIDFNTIHLITDNPEFAIAAIDVNDRILYGIKADGQPYWGVGVPKVVRDYVDKQVNDILGTDNITETIDSLKEVEKFLSDFKNSDTLKALLDTKANKTDVDNTIANINANIADIYKKSNPNDEEGNVIDTNSIKSVINNPEYFKAFVDNTNKLIEAIGLDGVRKFFAGIEVAGNKFTATDNPEYKAVLLDKDNKILIGIKNDGDIYFAAGVPSQIIDYINEKIAELSLDEYEDIVAFLNGLEEGDKTLQTLLNEKVDKEEGKSLIDAEYASSQSAIENPEFLDVTLDAEDKVLEGIQTDGTKVIGGDLKVLGNMEVSGVSYKVIENPEYLAAWVDADNKIIFGFKADGKTYVGDADFLNDIDNITAFLQNITDKNIDWDALSSISVTDNPEYIDIKIDSENKILEGITADGVKHINIPVDNGAAIIENTDNPEFLEAKVDAEGKLIEGINKNGEKIFGVIPPQIKQYIDDNMPAGGSGVQSIEYDDETGDMYATYDDEGGITDVSMEPNGDIYVEYEE